MMKIKNWYGVGVLAMSILASAQAFAQTGGQIGPGVPAFEVRKGYKVTLACEGLGEARFMEFDDKGTLYLAEPRYGRIIALKDKDGDGVFETKSEFFTGYKEVQGMKFIDGWLYATSAASNVDVCKRMRDTDGDGKADDIETFIPTNTIPQGGGHAYRAIEISEKYVYISVSDPGNMSDDLPSDRKCVYRFDRDGKNKLQYATGIRNTEKLRFRPGTEDLYGLDHGSDNFGQKQGDIPGKDQPITDLLPGEELNKFVEGAFYGHPFISNNRIIRPEYANRPDIHELAGKTTPPAWTFGAHWAGNGFTFLTKDYFPDHQGDMFCAFHGSWNSQQRVGYRIERVLFDKETGKPYGSLRIVGTLGKDNKILARPCDCVEAPDGTILFTCDTTQKIYRISKAD